MTTMFTNSNYLYCPKCEGLMRLRSDHSFPLPSGNAAGTATQLVNSTGTVNSNQTWYEYYCPNCGNTISSLIRYNEPD